MAPLKQNMVLRGVSGRCVMKACFCCWHHTAGPPSSAQTLTLCGSGPSVFFNHPNVEAARLTALHRRVKPLPRALINKHTTSQGVPRWSQSTHWMEHHSVMDQKDDRTWSLTLSSPVCPDLLLHSLALFDPPFLSESPHLSSISVVPLLLYGPLQTAQGTLDLIPHLPSPAGTNRSLNTPGEKLAC